MCEGLPILSPFPERAEHEPQADDGPGPADPPPQSGLVLRRREEQVEHDEHDRCSPDSELGYETERLHAPVDGLALHALTADRKDLRPKTILAVLRKHPTELEPN
jgi:hypothetical protein